MIVKIVVVSVVSKFVESMVDNVVSTLIVSIEDGEDVSVAKILKNKINNKYNSIVFIFK